MWFHNAHIWLLYVTFLNSWSEQFVVTQPYVKDNHILYYHMDVVWSVVSRHNYFTSTNHFVVQGWIRATPLYPTNTVLEGQLSTDTSNYFLGLSASFIQACTVPCHQISAVFDVTNNFVVTTFPIPCI